MDHSKIFFWNTMTVIGLKPKDGCYISAAYHCIQRPRSSCLTNEVGPATFRSCYGGWLSCNRIDLPPNVGQCLRYKENITDEAATYGASIVQIRGDLQMTCYPK